MADEWRRGDYVITTERARLDVAVIHGYLARSYWSKGVSREIVERSIAGSLCFGLFHHDQQVGFARVITDYATLGYLADVFVLEEHRGSGLGVWLIDVVMHHPRLRVSACGASPPAMPTDSTRSSAGARSPIRTA